MTIFGYSLYIAAGIYPKDYTLVPAAVILGVAAAPLWISLSTYITLVSVTLLVLLLLSSELELGFSAHYAPLMCLGLMCLIFYVYTLVKV